MMFRAKEGRNANAAVVAAAIATWPQVNCEGEAFGSPRSKETMGAFQFFQQNQPKSPASMIPRVIAKVLSGGHSFQILNARDAATESSLSREAGASARVSD